MGDNIPDNAPAPRLCHMVKWPDFDGFGFNLHADKNRPGQFIGKVDNDSPAEMAGIKESDRIIEVNGVNIANENHKQVVQRIKSIENETRLLVVDREADQWYKSHGMVVKGTLPNVVTGTSVKPTEEEEPQPTPPATNGHISSPDGDDGSVVSAESSHESETSTQPQQQQEQQLNSNTTDTEPLSAEADIPDVEKESKGEQPPLGDAPSTIISSNDEQIIKSAPDASADAPEALETSGVPDGLKTSDAPDAPEISDAPDALKSLDASDISDVPDASKTLDADAPEASETSEAPDGLKTSETATPAIADADHEPRPETLTEIVDANYDNFVFGQDTETTTTITDEKTDSSIDRRSSSVSSTSSGNSPASTSSPTNDDTTEVAPKEGDGDGIDAKSPMSMTPTPTTTPTPPPSEPAAPPHFEPAAAPPVSKPSPPATPPPTENKFTKSGLNLNMTAAEMRAQLAARKKTDPRNEHIDLKKKYQIIQNL